ncbi:MAG TPA: polysaccharide deacetylase family protein, partial [Desulfosporosinus sp.]|nr:polysaccharide deacetylase family protein [Desulfosporosinus sp.]
MEKKIIGAFLFVFLVLVFGSSGCTGPLSSPTSQTQLTTINPSKETYQDESNNLSRPSSVQEAQAVPILYYHSVMQENGNEVRMPPEQFEAQMDFLKDQGYQSVTLEQLYLAFYKGGGLPAKPFVITLDDGYEDNYSTAFPILKKHGFTATVFMVTSYINGEGFMSWPQLKELVANGWEIEGHTTSHPYLTKMDSPTVLSELHLSKELLEKELGRPVDFFAYPYGDLNANVVQALKDTG